MFNPSLLSTILVKFNLFSCLNHCHWERYESLVNKVCKCLASDLTNVSRFHPLEVVSCSSETQLQVGENLNYITQCFKG